MSTNVYAFEKWRVNGGEICQNCRLGSYLLFFIELIFLKVCGTTGCCFTPWSVNSVDEGEGVYVTGSSDLGECSQYDVNDGSQNNEIGIYFKSLRLNLNFKRKKNFRDFDWDVISISRYNCISSGFWCCPTGFCQCNAVCRNGRLSNFPMWHQWMDK